jgi:hypoxanthine-guanine phosphoribosyltransferase
MSSPNDQQPSNAGSSDDLKGLDILLVEDSRDVGEAVKKHLELLGAKVAGPAATTAERSR